jgi:opacity protein-like surface antigen
MARKILLMTALTLFFVGGLAAQTQGFSIGARVIGIKPFYEPSSDLKAGAGGYSVDLESGFGLGFAVQASYNFTEMLGIQAEALYNSDEITVKYGGRDYSTLKASSLLIPVLARVGTTVENGVQLTGLAGVYFTIPIGDAEGMVSNTGYSQKTDWKGSMGAMFGGVAGYQVGPGTIFADIRYAFDFSESEFISNGTTLKVWKKSAIHFGIGYSISL